MGKVTNPGDLATSAFSVAFTHTQVLPDVPSEPVSYPKLPGKKIQDPYHYGLGNRGMTGFWVEASNYWGLAGKTNYEELIRKYMKEYIERLEEKIGKPPSIWVYTLQKLLCPNTYRQRIWVPYRDRYRPDNEHGNNSLYILPCPGFW